MLSHYKLSSKTAEKESFLDVLARRHEELLQRPPALSLHSTREAKKMHLNTWLLHLVLRVLSVCRSQPIANVVVGVH